MWDLAMGISQGGSSFPLFPGWIGILVFVERGKPEDLEKNPQSEDKNQQQIQPRCDNRFRNHGPIPSPY